MTGEIPSTQRSSPALASAGRDAAGAWLALGVLVYALAPLAVAWSRRLPGIDPAWDFLMALGVVATGGCAVLPLLSARWWAGLHRDPVLLRLVQRLHRQLSYVMAAFVVVHVAGILMLEPRTLDYLLPTAPGYMLAGLVALLLLVVLVVTSQGRLKQGWPQASWRRWHAGFSALALAGLVWHLVGAGFWFAGAGPWLALGWLVGVPTGLSLYWRHHRTRTTTGLRVVGERVRRRRGLLTALSLFFILASAWFAWSSSARAPRTDHPLPCPVGRCL